LNKRGCLKSILKPIRYLSLLRKVQYPPAPWQGELAINYISKH
jgi:hypothetical protein